MFDEATWAAVAARVRRRALRCVGNAADAQDLAQESVQAALRHDGLRTRADLLGYCLGVLRRQVALYYRRQRYWQMVPLAAAAEPETGTNPGTALAHQETLRRVARLARHLTSEERVLLMWLLSGRSRAQLAQDLGVTRAQLRQRYHRLVQKLRHWDQDGPTPLRGVA